MDLSAKIHELKKLKLDVAEIEKKITEIEDIIKAEMETRNVSEMVVDIFKVHWKTFTTTRIDTAALKAELPDIVTRYSKTTESRRFSIT